MHPHSDIVIRLTLADSVVGTLVIAMPFPDMQWYLAAGVD
jgi:hypothetical protein